MEEEGREARRECKEEERGIQELCWGACSDEGGEVVYGGERRR